jgi:2-methylcitrate dehydratase PrpD
MITRQLARFVTDTATDTVPDAAIRRAGSAFVDTLGVALAGVSEEVATIARRVIASPSTGGEATIWGGAERASASDAAFANAVAVHALDFDDSSPSLRGHPSVTLMPVAFAAAEAAGASGRAMLASYAIGLEVASRVSAGFGAAHYLHGWHTTATAGIFGATAIAGRLFGLSADALQHAFGLAAARTSGLTRNFGTMAKPIQVGYAAQGAIEAARLAAAGITANAAIFDGPESLFAVYGCGTPVPTSESPADLGTRWTIVEAGVFVKRWPCCYAVHRPVAGLREIIAETGLAPDEISSVAVGFLPGVDHPLLHKTPSTGLEAKFSIEYAVAVVLLDGDLTIGSFADEEVLRPAVRRLMERVTRFRIPSDAKFNGLTGWTELVLETSRGRIERRIDRTPGSPEWALSPAEEAAKFLGCATRALPPEEAESLLHRARAIGSASDLRALFETTPARVPSPQMLLLN